MATKEKSVKDKSKKKHRATEDDTTTTTVETVAVVEPTSPAVKRKADLEELEVDVDAPEPPSKRAKRALKKGKALPAKAASDDDRDLRDDDEDDSEDGGKKAKERSEHGVWIGNLPFLVTGAGLKKWLVDNSGGVIAAEAITRVKIPKKKDPNRANKESNLTAPNKGFAYVDFSDLASKVAAVALSENELGGRKLLIKDSTSFEGRPKKEPEPDAAAAEGDKSLENASRKIFVGNMGFKTSEDDLRRNFEKCGEIEWVKLATFEDSGKCKGFGWVRFKEPIAAAWAVKGFVKIKEEIETEEDFQSDSETEGAEREKKFKTRKWWVNRMMGRELKIELAEDDQTRYKKRFGKDAGKKGERPEDREKGAPRGKREERGPRREKPRGDNTEMDVARLKGTVVEHTGSKVTFD
ncbi:RNA recognition motif domain-containing protein [Sarocladium implicatum]|nr:RNA recognition motif domain-containing protein [Sarocladium implicatum]